MTHVCYAQTWSILRTTEMIIRTPSDTYHVRPVKLLFSVELVQGLSKWNVHIGKNREWRQTWLTVHNTYRTKPRAQLHGSAGKRHESLAERPGKPSHLMADCGGRTSETLYTFSSIHQIGSDFQIAGRAYVESHQKACLGSEKPSEHVFDLSRAVQSRHHETTSDLRQGY